jgi:hypothetical protein
MIDEKLALLQENKLPALLDVIHDKRSDAPWLI